MLTYDFPLVDQSAGMRSYREPYPLTNPHRLFRCAKTAKETEINERFCLPPNYYFFPFIKHFRSALLVFRFFNRPQNLQKHLLLEREAGFEPVIATWKDAVLPLHYSRMFSGAFNPAEPSKV